MTTTFDKIKWCINSKNSFILEAGAGSWKTFTLIQTVEYLLEFYWESLRKNGQKIACITYTNIAKEEMMKRLDFNNLVEINTIHEFFWSVISNYQINLKKELIEYHNWFDSDKKIDDLEIILENIDVSYGKYWRRLEKWEITHEDVIELSIRLFWKYPRLINILTNQYPYFFIDEYQDTFTKIVKLFIDIQNDKQDTFLLWFFGDSMQKIYQDDRIGKIESTVLQKIEKVENFRSGKKIVNLINIIRSFWDWLKQIAQKDFEGEISFYYSNTVSDNETKYTLIKTQLWWDFNWKPKENKILVLSNKRISDDLWYRWLLDIFELRFDRYWAEQLKGNEEPYIDFLLNKVEKIIFYYNEKMYSEFFELFWNEDFKIKRLEDRSTLKKLILWLTKIRETWTISDVLNYVFENKIIVKTEKILNFESYLWETFQEIKKIERQTKARVFQEKLLNLKYTEVINYSNYTEDKTPYSTQHGTKWAEYNNVLLIIDDNHRWYLYKGFKDLVAGWLEDFTEKEKRERLLNLLYVSVSRAKEKLVILYLSEVDNLSLVWWKNIFWEENIHIL